MGTGRHLGGIGDVGGRGVGALGEMSGIACAGRGAGC
jgi:hypothetical protein